MDLNKLCNGAVQEVFDANLEEVFDNIRNPNTDPKIKRGLTLELKFEPDENQEVVKVDFSVKTKLAPFKSFGSHIHLYTDTNGELKAKEIGGNLPGQMDMTNLIPMEESEAQ